ncbi:hypothetical protein [Paenisporosarcina antarctica]|uniref:hypothetical protein n=1 Tax=Paenisporosarcina antarctica TaxID=417367 RepID=UPI001FB9253C|nr:hypothetical protein [Paenisporosarcina antarctica]
MVVIKQELMSSYSKVVKASLIASSVAGVVLGLFMQMRGMILTISSMVGSESMIIGWSMHMMISWIFGLGFGAMTLLSKRYYVVGALHGVIIWVMGPLLITPMMMDMGSMLGEMFAGALV